MASKSTILSLYKTLLRESQKFPTYNYRLYAIRRVRDAFRDNKTLSDKEKIAEEFIYGKKNLEIIKRQVVVGQLYGSDKLVIEKTM